jgi:hypothetical protein
VSLSMINEDHPGVQVIEDLIEQSRNHIIYSRSCGLGKWARSAIYQTENAKIKRLRDWLKREKIYQKEGL